MVISKRERYIVIATLAAAGLLLIDRVVYSPLMVQWNDIETRTDARRVELIDTNKLIKESREKSRQWSAMSGKRLPRNASEAESQILNSVREWASEARLPPLSAVKPERSEKEKDFYKMTFRATASGSMAQVSRFLYYIQTSSVPARITDVTITSRKEGTDELTLNLGIATIYPVPESEKTRPALQQTAALDGREVLR